MQQQGQPKVANSKVGLDLSLKLDCSFFQIGYRSLKPSEKIYISKNGIRIKFSSLTEPLTISNFGIAKIFLFSKDGKIYILLTTTRTWKSIETYSKKSNEYIISTYSGMNRIIISCNKMDNTDVQMLKNIYLEKIEVLDSQTMEEFLQEHEVSLQVLEEFLRESTSTSKSNISNTQPPQKQVCNVNHFLDKNILGYHHENEKIIIFI